MVTGSPIPGKESLVMLVNTSISQIPQCGIRQISHKVPFCNRDALTCAHFCHKMMHRGVWDRCIMGCMQHWPMGIVVYYIFPCYVQARRHGYFSVFPLSQRKVRANILPWIKHIEAEIIMIIMIIKKISRQRYNGRHFADDIFKHIFLNESDCILHFKFPMALKYISKDANDIKPAFITVTS